MYLNVHTKRLYVFKENHSNTFDIAIVFFKFLEHFHSFTFISEANDIALIRLPRLANTFLEGPEYKVMPICLGWNLNGTQVPSENSIVAGWGRTDKRPVHGGGDFENSGAYR